MLESQRVAIELSEVREAINGLPADASTDDINELTTKYGRLEARYRAALIVEGADDDAAAAGEPNAEERELQQLAQRASVGEYLRAAASGSQVQGAEREYRAAVLGEDATEESMPIDMLLGMDGGGEEHRADVQTNIADAVQDNQRTIAGRIFSRTAAAYLGVGRPTVPVGTSTYIALATGATADIRSDGVAKDAEAFTLSTKSVNPVRVQARYKFGIESAARIRGLEDALRADLRAVLGDKLDSLAISGQAAVTNVSPAVEGIISSLTDPTDPTAVAAWSDYDSLYAGRVDGKYSVDGSNVRVLVNPATLKQAYGLQVATSGELLRNDTAI